MRGSLLAAAVAIGAMGVVFADNGKISPREVSGIYPGLAMFNDEGECGTGAVVPWAGHLWVITYAPHEPWGSSGKLYEITPELEQVASPSDAKVTGGLAYARDDLWKVGKPSGFGGPSKNTPVQANVPSDPYLLTGYDKKALHLSHDSKDAIKVTLEIDPSGTGQRVSYQTLDVPASREVSFSFPDAFSAYWLRLKADKNCNATGQLEYR